MRVKRKYLVELFRMLGFPSASSWSKDKLLTRANRLNEMPPELGKMLPKSAGALFSACQATAEAFDNGWGEPIRLPKPKPRRVYITTAMELPEAEAVRLHDWLKKFGFRPPTESWKGLSPASKIDVCEEAVVRIVTELLASGGV